MSLRLYLDSCLVIYAVEGSHPLSEALKAKLRDHPGVSLCTSGLVQLECLVGPMRNRNTALVDRFNNFFHRTNILPVSRSAFLRAAELRAETALSLPDALHLAIAETSGCEEFWTSDWHFKTQQAIEKLQVRIVV